MIICGYGKTETNSKHKPELFPLQYDQSCFLPLILFNLAEDIWVMLDLILEGRIGNTELRGWGRV